MRRRALKLTADDKRAFEKYQETGDLAWLTGYYFGGFTFMPWQNEVCSSEVGDAVIVGGVGSGKTMGHAAEELVWGLTTKGYGSMTLAPTSWQANLTYRAMLERIGEGPFRRFLAKDPVSRPWPMIELTTGARFEFRSASDIDLIQGWGGDSMAIDEAGVITEGDYIISGMASRLRGIVQGPGGYKRARRGRLKIVTASYFGGDWVFTRYDQPRLDDQILYEAYNEKVKKGQPIHYLRGPDQISMTVTSASNIGLTELDISRMKRRISAELVDMQMSGARPVGQGEIYTVSMIRLCEDWSMNAEMEEALRGSKKGWEEKVIPSIGPTAWRRPRIDGRIYMMAGDPGTANPPHRNSAVVMVFDVTEFPKEPASLVSLQWVFGNGTINPFLATYFSDYNLWRPEFALFDATGTQKHFDAMVFTGWGLPAEGVDFSGMKKNADVGALSFLMSRGLLRFPYIQGLRAQLSGYRLPDTNLAQDIVSTLCMIAGKLRTYLVQEEEATIGVQEAAVESPVSSRNYRSPRAVRSVRNPNRRRRR